jgi:hypothetical protein
MPAMNNDLPLLVRALLVRAIGAFLRANAAVEHTSPFAIRLNLAHLMRAEGEIY